MNLTSLCPQLTKLWAPRVTKLCLRNNEQHLETQTWHSTKKQSRLWISPTNPQADIMASGYCKFWVILLVVIDLKSKAKNNPLPCTPTSKDPSLHTIMPSPLVLPRTHTSKMACESARGEPFLKASQLCHANSLLLTHSRFGIHTRVPQFMLHSRDYLLIQPWPCHPLLLEQQRKFTPLPKLEYANTCCLQHSSTLAPEWSQSHLDQGPGSWHSWSKLEAHNLTNNLILNAHYSRAGLKFVCWKVW